MKLFIGQSEQYSIDFLFIHFMCNNFVFFCICSRYYSVSADQLPSQIRDAIENVCQEQNHGNINDDESNRGAEASPSTNELTSKKRYHTLDVHRSPIVLVDSREKFNRMLTILFGESVIGFDAEWKPISTSTSDVALIQLATNRCIYLIDVIVNNFTTDDWDRLATNIFNNLEILKLGKCKSTNISINYQLLI